MFGPSFSEKLINPQKFIKRPFNSLFKEIKNKELILDYFFEIKKNRQNDSLLQTQIPTELDGGYL